jgi:hypothetical protein
VCVRERERDRKYMHGKNRKRERIRKKEREKEKDGRESFVFHHFLDLVTVPLKYHSVTNCVVH